MTADPILQRKEFEIRGRTKNLIRIVSHCYREGMSRCRINTLCEPILRTKDLEITIETKDLFCLACLSWPLAERNECVSDPCQNGGICIDQVNRYTCQCRAGTTGDHCEIGREQLIMPQVIRHLLKLAPSKRKEKNHRRDEGNLMLGQKQWNLKFIVFAQLHAKTFSAFPIECFFKDDVFLTAVFVLNHKY